jgi:hypothetical protein
MDVSAAGVEGDMAMTMLHGAYLLTPTWTAPIRAIRDRLSRHGLEAQGCREARGFTVGGLTCRSLDEGQAGIKWLGPSLRLCGERYLVVVALWMDTLMATSRPCTQHP